MQDLDSILKNGSSLYRKYITTQEKNSIDSDSGTAIQNLQQHQQQQGIDDIYDSYFPHNRILLVIWR